jgi:hypothetical protein
LDLTAKAELVNGHVTLKQDQTFEFAFVTRATAGSFVGPDIRSPSFTMPHPSDRPRATPARA